ncbi:DUF4340 domain-containing protein [Nitrosomonadales bacterium]|jgi:hypothetical protein|nr:DUF4340 domain-containing protein [Nitrosomonadales bacterium]
MKSRWLTNIGMLVIVLITSLYSWTIFQKEPVESVKFELTKFKLSDFDEVKIDFPSKISTHFKIIDDHWRMLSPHKARADELYVYRILSILATSSLEKLSANDLSKYGLDQPNLKITFLGDNLKEVILFGTYNPINEYQYVLYKNNVFLISGGFSETASYMPVELIEKSPIAKSEIIKSFDFSRLEQWQDARLKLNYSNSIWSVTGKDLSIVQFDVNEWYEMTWKNIPAKSVEPYEIDQRVGYKSFDVLLNNKKITFYRIQESPELLLFRKDEGLLYHFPSDLGFTMLNPHVQQKEEK